MYSAQLVNQERWDPSARGLVAAICSPDRDSLSRVKCLLDAREEINFVAQCDVPSRMTQFCKMQRPDLIYIDVRQSNFNAAQLALTLSETYSPQIFMYMRDQPSRDNPTGMYIYDYRPMPLNERTLDASIHRNSHKPAHGGFGEFCAKTPISAPKSSSSVNKSKLPHEWDTNKHRKLKLRDCGIIKILPFDDIHFVEAAGDYMCLHVNGETTIMRSTMRELLKRLNDPVFARIHRSTVVNITQIVELTSLPKGDGMVQLANGRSLKVSRNYISALQEQILMHQNGPQDTRPTHLAYV